MRLVAGALLAATVAPSACTDASVDSVSEKPAATDVAGTASAAAADDGFVLPPPEPFDPNPLGLPATSLRLQAGQRVFAVPRRMLEHAREGASMALHLARVEAMDGERPIVRIGDGPAYPIDPGYVVSLGAGRLAHGTWVIAPYRDKLRHGVVTGLGPGRVMVRFTDLGHRRAELGLDPKDVGVLRGGLEPGGFAVFRAAREYRHVLLVSAHDTPTRRWLTLGQVGESRIIDERSLSVPPPRFEPKAGSRVLVAFHGSMVPGTVQRVERPELYTVKRHRVGAPLLVGPGMLMPAEGG